MTTKIIGTFKVMGAHGKGKRGMFLTPKWTGNYMDLEITNYTLEQLQKLGDELVNVKYERYGN